VEVSFIFVDCEAPFGVGSPAVGDMTEFGAVEYKSRRTFHGTDCSKFTFELFAAWLTEVSDGKSIFVSDNPAYDWQWINFYFWKHLGGNPMGFSARRIGDFYAGLRGDFSKANHWKHLRRTVHDHNPVNDAMGNCEALERMLNGER
jgi:hypothetical protein